MWLNISGFIPISFYLLRVSISSLLAISLFARQHCASFVSSCLCPGMDCEKKHYFNWLKKNYYLFVLCFYRMIRKSYSVTGYPVLIYWTHLQGRNILLINLFDFKFPLLSPSHHLIRGGKSVTLWWIFKYAKYLTTLVKNCAFFWLTQYILPSKTINNE